MAAPILPAGPALTALGATLHRRADGWCWKGYRTPDPRVWDLKLADLAPAFPLAWAGAETWVLVPNGWRETADWELDPIVHRVIDELVTEMGSPLAAQVECLADHSPDILSASMRSIDPGRLVPLALWQAILGEPIGVRFAAGQSGSIFDRARSLGWTGGAR